MSACAVIPPVSDAVNDRPAFDRVRLSPDRSVDRSAPGPSSEHGPHDGHQELVRLTKTKSGWLQRDNLIPVRFVPLLPGKAREL